MANFISAQDSVIRAEIAFPFGQTAELNSAVQPLAAPLVLLIKRDADARFMLKTILELWDYRVDEEDGGDVEGSIARAVKIRPDAILLDITLEYMNGIKTLRRLRKSRALDRVPIIFFSGHAQPAFRNMVLALGGSDLFVKPVDFDRLRVALDGLVKGAANFGGLEQ